MREIRDIIWADYNDLFPNNELLLAHLYTECGSLSETCDYKEGQSRNDYGYGIGMAQWNIHIRFAKWMKQRGFYYRPSNGAYTTTVRNEFLKDHPHMATWQGQTRAYLDEMKACNEKNPIENCIRKWNWNAGMPYLYKVQGNIDNVQKIIN
jgi:hypothetical protein